MTASVSLPHGAREVASGHQEFDLVESSAGWLLTITLTEQLRQALTGSTEGDAPATFSVRVAPNLVPGEAFDVTLRLRDPEGEVEVDAAAPRRPSPA